MIEIKIEISQKRYEELIKNEEKYKQYKQFLVNSTSNATIKILQAIERKNLWEILQENNDNDNNNKNESEEN